MPPPRSSRLNLARWREPGRIAHAERITCDQAIDMELGTAIARASEAATQGELAKALGVRRSYVCRILLRLPFDAPIELLAASPITPAHVLSMRQREQQCRRQQDEQARRESEEWTAAWREEEARVRQVGCRPDQGLGDEER